MNLLKLVPQESLGSMLVSVVGSTNIPGEHRDKINQNNSTQKRLNGTCSPLQGVNLQGVKES